jgi:primosomal protein N' (replication factor Y) (superfamily II helicase)
VRLPQVSSCVLQVAIPAPVRGPFDYLHDGPVPPLGCRVRVEFGPRQRVGFVVGSTAVDDSGRTLKRVLEVLDLQAWFTPDLWQMLRFAADYYQRELGEVLALALPAALRRSRLPRIRTAQVWRRIQDGPDLARSVDQARLLGLLSETAQPQTVLEQALPGALASLRQLRRRGIVESIDELPGVLGLGRVGPALEADQRAAIATLTQAKPGYCPWLLEGVTGSGKTEVYLELARTVLAAGQQVLLLVPEIGLVPQMLERARQRLSGRLAVLHSELAETERLVIHQAIARGQIDCVVGTRSALFAPLAKLGLIVVDEEHDAAYKQQEGVRYHARDLALVRASKLDIPVLLGSATPSLETLANVARGRCQRLSLPLRAGGAVAPKWWLEDLSSAPPREVVGHEALRLIGQQLERDRQVLVFRNRRGYAPVLVCGDCGWQAQCGACDARLVLHRGEGRLRCHHCGHQENLPLACPECGSLGLRPLGVGTERVEDVLGKHFPGVPLYRFDRDSVARKGSRETALEALRSGGAAIIVGTQMLAKGHDLPRLGLVVVCQLDESLYSVDYRATERLAQLLIQVGGRAGRREKAGLVVLETAHPQHPVLRKLLDEGYPAFAEATLEQRRQAGLPPWSHAALLRADAPEREPLDAWLVELRAHLDQINGGGVQVHGPLLPQMSRRAGRERGQLLLLADTLPPLQQLLRELRKALAKRRGAVHCSIDVDPLDWY